MSNPLSGISNILERCIDPVIKYCQCCLVYYTTCKDSDKEWHLVRPKCSKCSSLLELDEVLKDGTAVFMCPECGEVLILEPIGKK